ncbi:hypothetical protein D3C72_682920 [compost metagenome]
MRTHAQVGHLAGLSRNSYLFQRILWRNIHIQLLTAVHVDGKCLVAHIAREIYLQLVATLWKTQGVKTVLICGNKCFSALNLNNGSRKCFLRVAFLDKPTQGKLCLGKGRARCGKSPNHS